MSTRAHYRIFPPLLNMGEGRAIELVKRALKEKNSETKTACIPESFVKVWSYTLQLDLKYDGLHYSEEHEAVDCAPVTYYAKNIIIRFIDDMNDFVATTVWGDGIVTNEHYVVSKESERDDNGEALIVRIPQAIYDMGINIDSEEYDIELDKLIEINRLKHYM